MKLLHVIATPRGRDSRTLRLSKAVLERLEAEVSGLLVDTLDLFSEQLPQFGAAPVEMKYSLMSGDPGRRHPAGWAPIERQIRRFLAADVVLISTPMWNFGVPYVLKHYIDVIMQPGYLFRYTEKGPVGLAKGKSVLVVSTRGGDYGPGSPWKAMDHLEPYLRTVFGFAGITELRFITAQPMDAGGEKVAEQRMKAAEEELKALFLPAQAASV